MQYDRIYINSLYKRDKENISMRYRAWNFFRWHILNNPALRLSSIEEYDFEQLRKGIPRKYRTNSSQRCKWENLLRYYWSICLDPTLPFVIVDDEYGGLEIRAKRTVPLQSLGIKGFLFVLSEKEFQLAVDSHFSSLFDGSRSINGCTGKGILFGPMSLLNHSCNSLIRFPMHKTVSFPLCKRNKCLTFESLKAEEDVEILLKKNEPVLVKYYNIDDDVNHFFECKCSAH